MNTTTNYAYGHNLPGCLPDNPPFIADTFADAKAGLLWDLRFWEDYAETEDDAEDFAAAAQDANLWTSPQDITVAGRVFFIVETDEDADDETDDLAVCTDCYFAHHYGTTEHEGQWLAGESDSPADRQPLGLIGTSAEVADNTDSETGEGIETFSWSVCDGCGSTLGGARYRLAVTL